MKSRVARLMVLMAGLAVFGTSSAQAQSLINLPLVRQADGVNQQVDTVWYIYGQPHTGQGGELTYNLTDAQSLLAYREPVTGDLINSGGLIVFSHPTAGASASVAVGSSTQTPNVSAYGRVATVVDVSNPEDNGWGWSTSSANAEATFRINRHATNTQGSQNNAWVTVRGNFSLIVYGQNVGNLEDPNNGRDIDITLGNSYLTAQETGEAGWIISGVLQNSTRTTPTAAPSGYYTVTNSGMNFPTIGFTQAAHINDDLDFEANATFPGNVQQTVPEEASDKSTVWNYSIQARCTVEDITIDH